jgi:uncharacterized protein YjfI (DUF2170 family)
MGNILKSLFFSLFVISCSSALQNQTTEFNSYLSRQFNSTIPESDHVYILQSKFGCQECIRQVYQMIEEMISDASVQRQTISILTYDTSFLTETLINECRIHFDKNAEYEYLGLETANITLIKTSKRMIIDTWIIPKDEIESVSGFFN